MFAPYCPACGQRVLLGTRRLVAMDMTSSTAVILVRCFCGSILDATREAPQVPDLPVANLSATDEGVAVDSVREPSQQQLPEPSTQSSPATTTSSARSEGRGT